jgi:hypothetical protein
VILPDVGGYIYAQNEAVATLSISPLADRALSVTSIHVSNVSAADNWDVSVGGRVLMSFRALTVGNQRLLNNSQSATAARRDYWTFIREQLGMDPSIPVPNGQTLTVSSRGGATADIDIEALETDIGTQNVKGTNHYLGSRFIMPISWFLNASVSAIGAVQLDTQVSPAWIPAIFSAVQLPADWTIRLLALFLEGEGVNTFSGAADHQSTTRDLRVFWNNVQAFTRSGLGWPNRGAAAAAGSANSVFGQRSGVYQPWEAYRAGADNMLPVPLVLKRGNTLQLLHDITGDVTGGASYANALVVAIADVTVPVGEGIA